MIKIYQIIKISYLSDQTRIKTVLINPYGLRTYLEHYVREKRIIDKNNVEKVFKWIDPWTIKASLND